MARVRREGGRLMRLVGYIRCSDEDAGERHSISNQEYLLNKYCELYGHELIEVFVDDGVSGGTEFQKRPGGSELMECLREGLADGVVARDIERMFRRTINGLVMVEEFDRRGVSLHFVNDKIDTSDPDGYFFLTIKLGMAQRERDRTRLRNKQVSDQLKAEGKVYGAVPFGMVRAGDMLLKHPGYWAVREMIVNLRRERDMSLSQISQHLQTEGIPNPSGGRLWHKSTLKIIIDTHDDYEHIPLLGRDNETSVSLEGNS